jgi:hypothetical protein
VVVTVIVYKEFAEIYLVAMEFAMQLRIVILVQMIVTYATIGTMKIGENVMQLAAKE